MSERDGEVAARGAPLAATEPVVATQQAVAGTRRTAQLVLGLLFILILGTEVMGDGVMEGADRS